MLGLLNDQFNRFLDCYRKLNPELRDLRRHLHVKRATTTDWSVVSMRTDLIRFLRLLNLTSSLLDCAKFYAKDLRRHVRGVPMTEHYHKNLKSRLTHVVELTVQEWFELVNPTEISTSQYEKEPLFREICVAPPHNRLVTGRFKHTCLFTIEVLSKRLAATESLTYVIAYGFVRDPGPHRAEAIEQPLRSRASGVRLRTRTLDLNLQESIHALRDEFLQAQDPVRLHAERLAAFIASVFPLEALTRGVR